MESNDKKFVGKEGFNLLIVEKFRYIVIVPRMV